MMLTVLDLFSGIGGFSLGLERTGQFRTVAFCEIDPFCRKVLSRHWPDVPCHQDITKLRGEDVGHVDVICGGFPCQPWSLAGERRGEDDDRHLWSEMVRLVREIRPTWVIGENVAGIVSMGLDLVLDDLEAEGYATWPAIIPAAAAGACHRRDRVWIVASANGSERRENDAPGRRVAGEVGLPQRAKSPGIAGRYGKDASDANGVGSQSRRRNQKIQSIPRSGSWHDVERRIANHWLSPQPGFRAVDDGLSRGVAGRRRKEQLTALGNAVVPQIPEMIGHAILEAEAA